MAKVENTLKTWKLCVRLVDDIKMQFIERDDLHCILCLVSWYVTISILSQHQIFSLDFVQLAN